MWQLTDKNGNATEDMVWREREGSIEVLVKYKQILVFTAYTTQAGLTTGL